VNLPRLYAISDEEIVPNEELLEKVEEVLVAGVKLFQVRFKKTPHEEQYRLGKKLRELTRAHDALFIFNDSPEVARSVQADGVHLGANDPRVSFARRLLGQKAIIGVSCYDRIDRVVKWGPQEISHLGMATPYPSPTKPKVNPDIEEFTNLVSHARVPAYAIGGVTLERVGEMLKAGCYGVAVVSAVFAAEDPARAVLEFSEEIKKYAP